MALKRPCHCWLSDRTRRVRAAGLAAPRAVVTPHLGHESLDTTLAKGRMIRSLGRSHGQQVTSTMRSR